MNNSNNNSATERSIGCIFNAVEQATSVTTEQVLSPYRKRQFVKARMIIAHHLRYLLRLTLKQVAEIMGRKSYQAIMHLLVQYDLDYQFSPGFSTLADNITEILINSIEQQTKPCITQC